MRVVADTAILVRANAHAEGPARKLIELIRQVGGKLIVSPFILAEVERVLNYPRIQELYCLSSREISEHLQLIVSMSDLVLAMEGPRIVPKDAADDPIVYAALAGRADVLLHR